METRQENFDDEVKRLGVKIKRAREEKNLTLKELGGRVGLSISYLNDIERGRRHPSHKTLHQLSQSLNVPYNQLVSSQEEVDDFLQKVLDAIPARAQKDLFRPYHASQQDFSKLVMRHPSLLNVILKSLVKIGRAHDFSETDFFYALLSSHLEEDRENFYNDIEKKVEEFRKKIRIKDSERSITYERLKTLLKEEKRKKDSELSFELEDADDFKDHRHLSAYIRSIRIHEENRLLINSKLSKASKVFQLAREIGYRVLRLQEINSTSPPLGKISFLHLWHDQLASSFAGALLMNRDLVKKDMSEFFCNEQWSEKSFRRIVDSYGVMPEMFLYRLHEVLPEAFGLKQIHFLRFQRTEYLRTGEGKFEGNSKDDSDKGRYELSPKCLNAGEIPFSPTVSQREKYCRRFLAIHLLRDLTKQKDKQTPLIGAQRSILLGSEKEFFCLTVARPLTLSDVLVSVSLGFVIDDQFRKVVRFWNDSRNIPVAYVGSTCERCPLKRLPRRGKKVEISNREECSDWAPGAADAHLYEREKWQGEIEKNLQSFMEENSRSKR